VHLVNFLARLLKPIFSQLNCAGAHGFDHPRRIDGFANGNDGHIIRIAPRSVRGLDNALLHLEPTLGNGRLFR
jgi:hypothetical protein